MKKNIQKILTITGAFSMLTFLGCEEPENATPRPDTTPITLTTNMTFVNASLEAGSLDFYVNGLKIGESTASGAAQTGFTPIPITATFYGGGSTTAGANTSIRAKATNGTIGGALGSSDLIYRQGNANTTNLTAANGSFYTLIALDSVDRPKPIRTLNANNFADTTFFNPLTGAYISRVEKAALPSAQRAKVVAIGTVPLGSTDPGGIRFALLTETLTAFAVGNTTQSQIRFLNLSPNGGTLFVRLKPAAGATIPAAATSSPYILSFPGFSPSVGSRNTTAAFTLQTTVSAGTPIDYNIEVSTESTFTTGLVYTSPTPVTFLANKTYTVYAKGFKGAISAGVATHR